MIDFDIRMEMNYDEVLEDLQIMFPDKIFLTKIELSKAIGKSVPTINRYLAKGICVNHKKVGNGRGKILFHIREVAKWMTTDIIEQKQNKAN